MFQLIINYPNAHNFAERILTESLFLRAEESENIPKTDEEIEDDFEDDLEGDLNEDVEDDFDESVGRE